MVGGRIPAERAVGILDEVLRTHPASPIAHLMLGQAAARAGDMDRAIDGYLGAVRLDDSLAEPVGEQIHKITARPGIAGSHLVRMAHFQRERGDHHGAAALLDKALHMDPALADRVLGELRDEFDGDEGSVDLLVVGAHAARRTGDVERACETLVRIDARDPARFEIVLAEFRKLRETCPGRLLPVLCMARVLIHHGAPEAAAQTVSDASADRAFALDERVEMLHEFHRRLPEDPTLSLALAARLGEQGHHDAAVEQVRAAMELSGFDVDRAVEVTHAVLEGEPAHPGLRLLQHDLLVAAGRVGEALRAVPDPASLVDWQQHEISERLGTHRALVVADPELASVYARSLGTQGRTEEAIAVLTEAAEGTGSGSGHPIWTELAAALHENGDREASRHVLLEQARDEDERRLAHQRYGSWSEQRIEGELRALEERHRARPDATHVALDYAERLLEYGRPADVAQVLDRTPPTDEWKVRRAVLLGRAQLAMNRADRARAVLSAAAPLAGDDDTGRELLFRLSECEERLGRPAAATARLEQLLDDEIFASRATPRVKRTYGQYLEDVAGTRRAVLTRVSSL
jgi:predicted Zn-dependent protease